jgi:Zn-dependent M28 family amino/carboxypeptidase
VYTSAGDGGTIVMSGYGGAASRKKGAADELPCVKVSAESYGGIIRILEKNIPGTLELEMTNTFYDNPDVFNIIGEISGTDPKIKDEVVMIGAHFDSWTFGTGATDDGAGCAVMMEAMRILAALKVEPRRTIRIGLWTGEEQGALGSKAYCQKHFCDSVRLENGEQSPPKPEQSKFSVYFNLDGGTGKIRGIHLPGDPSAVRPIFQAWMGPFANLGMKTVALSDIGGADHYSFARAGLPSFGFIQDPIEYGTRTHHTSADVYERIQAEDMRFNAAVLASFAWQAAQRDEKLPRGGS